MLEVSELGRGMFGLLELIEMGTLGDLRVKVEEFSVRGVPVGFFVVGLARL